MLGHICRTCLIHLQRTCQPEEMLCFTCSSDEVPGELLLFSPDRAWCKHARSSQRPPSIIAFQRPRPPFVVGLFRPLLSLRNFASSFFLLFRSQSASQFSAAVADGALSLFSSILSEILAMSAAPQSIFYGGGGVEDRGDASLLS